MTNYAPTVYAHRRSGRDEPILDPEIPIVDAGHHLFVRPGLRYLFDDYLEDLRAGHRIVASVYIETNAFARPDGPDLMRPLGEIEFANGVGAMSASGVFGALRICAGIVGHVDLQSGDGVAAYLDAAMQSAPERFRGVRQAANHQPGELPVRYMPGQAPRGLLLDNAFRAGFRHLASRGLTFDAGLFHHQLQELADLADAFPDTTIVINHCGLALGLDADGRAPSGVFRQWREAMRDIARRPNVVCKVGGLGLPFWGFGFEERTDPIGSAELAKTWAPYVETVIEAFAPGRCMFESDYPADAMSCGFVPLWNAFKHIVRSATPSEKAALFHGTAVHVYRLSKAGLPETGLFTDAEQMR